MEYAYNRPDVSYTWTQTRLRTRTARNSQGGEASSPSGDILFSAGVVGYITFIDIRSEADL